MINKIEQFLSRFGYRKWVYIGNAYKPYYKVKYYQCSLTNEVKEEHEVYNDRW